MNQINKQQRDTTSCEVNIQFLSKMFQSNIIARLYFMQAIIDIQRQCNRLYSRLKSKLILLIGFRLNQLRSLKPLTSAFTQSSSYHHRSSVCDRQRWDQELERSKSEFEGHSNGWLGRSGTSYLVSDCAKTAVSIPMQILLLPSIMVRQQQQQQQQTLNQQTPFHSSEHLTIPWFMFSTTAGEGRGRPMDGMNSIPHGGAGESLGCAEECAGLLSSGHQSANKSFHQRANHNQSSKGSATSRAFNSTTASDDTRTSCIQNWSTSTNMANHNKLKRGLWC